MDSSAPRLSRSHASSLTTIAGKPAPTKGRAYAETVGASLLAMNSSGPRLSRSHALSLTTIASKLAPTKTPKTKALKSPHWAGFVGEYK